MTHEIHQFTCFVERLDGAYQHPTGDGGPAHSTVIELRLTQIALIRVDPAHKNQAVGLIGKPRLMGEIILNSGHRQIAWALGDDWQRLREAFRGQE